MKRKHIITIAVSALLTFGGLASITAHHMHHKMHYLANENGEGNMHGCWNYCAEEGNTEAISE